MKKQTFAIAMALLIPILVLPGCGAKSELDANREKWNAANIGHYKFELTISCFCAFMDIMPVAVEIQDGQIVSMTDVNGQAVSDELRQYIDEAATIEGLFRIVAKDLSEAEEIEIAYDAQYGYPSQINVDFIKLAMDDEISYSVNGFTPLP